MNNRLIYFSRPPKGCKCSPLFLAGNYSNKLLLAGDVEVNPGPGGSSFPCGLCEMDANWSNGGIACEHCDVWYHRDCACLNLGALILEHVSEIMADTCNVNTRPKKNIK